MLKSTKDLINIVKKKASEHNSYDEAQKLLQQGADVTTTTKKGSMIDSVIAEEKRLRQTIPWKADNCLRLIQILEKGASDRLSAQVFSANGGDLEGMYTLVHLHASCYQSTTYGSLGLLGALLKQDKVPIRLDVVQFLIESDPNTKCSLTTADTEAQTCLSRAKKNPKCPRDVTHYIQRQLDGILNQIPITQPQIDPNEVITWIRRGADIEAIDEKRNTALSNAVITNNLALADALVSAGSNIAHENGDRLTPLQIAKKATPKNPQLIALLEAQGVNVELKRLIEIKKSQLTIDEVHTVLANGANINATFTNKDSPLHLLISNKGKPEMVAAFVNDFNADLSAMNTNGHRPIETCILLDEDPFVYLLTLFKLPKMTLDLFHNPRLNKTLLQFAIDEQRVGAAKIIRGELNIRLWNCMARTNTKEDNNETIMKEFSQLIGCGAQINHQHEDKEYKWWTVPHLACKTSTKQVVQYIIKHLGADFTLQNHNGDYPISIAAEYGHLPIVEYLHSLPKSSVNVVNKDQQTVLHLATKNHHLLVVRYLVKWGADHQAQNNSKQTPLDIARANASKTKEEEMSDKKLIQFLEQLICPPVDDLGQQSSKAIKSSSDIDTCELGTPVVISDIQISTEDTDEALKKQIKGFLFGSPNNNLHDAAKTGALWMAKQAIGQGADIRHRKGNRTPYEVAQISMKEYSIKLSSPMLSLADRPRIQTMADGCQQIADMIRQIAQTKVVEAIDQSNAGLVVAYHLAGAPLTDNVDLVTWLCECGSTPTICDINGDYPIIQATEKGDYAMVELFVTKYPATKRQTNKAGLTALQIAQKLKFARIAELIETGKAVPQSSKHPDENNNKPKYDYETLAQAACNGHVKIIQEFIDERYESKEEKRRLCYELIQVAKTAKQFQIVDILEPYYNTKLRTQLASDMEIGSAVILGEHYKRILLGFLSALSGIIADSPVVLDPADPNTYRDLFSDLTANIAKRSQELQRVTSEQDVKKLINQDEANTKERLTKINEQLQQLLESRNSLEARIQDTDERLFKQQRLTALQRKELTKEKEVYAQQLATYECSIFLFQRQQEATLIRQKTINFIKANTNLIMFYRIIENQLDALFLSALAAQGGYLKTETTMKSSVTGTIVNMLQTKIPILNVASASIKAVLGPVLSKLNEKEQKKEWYNISTLGNVEELRRISSDTAGLVTLYYREQIQSIDPLQKIKGSNVFNDKMQWLKQVYDVRPESSEEIAVVMVAEYVTAWIIDGLKAGKDKIIPTEPLPQQLWLHVAKNDPTDQRKMTKITDVVGISAGQQRIPLKVRNYFGDEIRKQVQLRYLIGCVSVIGSDGSIYQYPTPTKACDNELEDLEVFGYVYVAPFSSDDKAFQSIVEGRKLDLAKRDKHGNILTRFADIIEYAQTYASQNDQHDGKSLITKETANQIAEVLREKKIFLDSKDVKEELRKARETIELSVDVLREEVQEKACFYQTSIDAAHEQIKQESKTNRETMKTDNEKRYDEAWNKLNEQFRDTKKRLEQLIAKLMNNIEKQIQEKTQEILKIAESAKTQSIQAVAQANQAIETSQRSVQKATEAAASTQKIVQWAEQRSLEFQSTLKTCETTFKQEAAAQKEFC
ncbi:unnamed protein product [Rotaria sp. Silwood2]|nr:unnamed protein product [Rotaria sp. Silwood2]